MASAAGLAGWLGFKTESTYGTAVTVDQFHPGYLSDNPVRNQPPIWSNGVRQGRRVRTCVRAGAKTVQGPFKTELYAQPLATLLLHCFGAVSTTGAGPYEHVYTPGTRDGRSLTVQVGIPSKSGTVNPFTYKGLKITGWSLSVTPGTTPAMLDLDTVAQDYVTGTAAASADYSGAVCPFTFVDASVTVDGSAVDEFKSLTLAGSVPHLIEHSAGSLLIVEPYETGFDQYTIGFTPAHEDLTLHDLANSEIDVVFTLDNGTQSLVVEMNTWVEPGSPTHGGAESLSNETFSATCYGSTDADAITATLTNSETTAA